MESNGGRKYLVIPADTFETFAATVENPVQASLKAAQEFADNLSIEAKKSDPDSNPRFAIVELAGIMETAVEVRTKRNFQTSRQIVRRSPEEIDAERKAKEARAKEAAASGKPRRGRKPGQHKGNK